MSGRTLAGPPRAKGRRYPVEISVAAWLDLLGYGAMLRSAQFDPTKPAAKEAVSRLKQFQETASAHGATRLPVMIINDGAVMFRDLSPRSASVTFDFLARAIDLFVAVNSTETGAGYPGARMVIAAGARMRVASVVKPSIAHRNDILKRLGERQLSAKQAVYEAFRAEPVAGFVPMLQANFAFTKAFLADHDGSKAGLVGPNCYIDTAIFNQPIPSWISFSRFQPWAQPGLKAEFGELSCLDRAAAGREDHRGIRDALEVAAHLGVIY